MSMPMKLKPLAQSGTQFRIDRVQVLVVVSGERAANLIKSIFNQLGFTKLLIAYDADQAVQMMKEVMIDLVVADAEIKASPLFLDEAAIGEEGVSEQGNVPGIQLVRHLRMHPNSPNPYIPIIMLVNQATTVTILAARDCGANEIVLKPINAASFCARLVAAVDKPRPFITATTYKGPDRRRKQVPLPPGMVERRKKDIMVVRNS